MDATPLVNPLINKVYEALERKGDEELPPPYLKPLPKGTRYEFQSIWFHFRCWLVERNIVPLSATRTPRPCNILIMVLTSHFRVSKLQNMKLFQKFQWNNYLNGARERTCRPAQSLRNSQQNNLEFTLCWKLIHKSSLILNNFQHRVSMIMPLHSNLVFIMSLHVPIITHPSTNPRESIIVLPQRKHKCNTRYDTCAQGA